MKFKNAREAKTSKISFMRKFNNIIFFFTGSQSKILIQKLNFSEFSNGHIRNLKKNRKSLRKSKNRNSVKADRNLIGRTSANARKEGSLSNYKVRSAK